MESREKERRRRFGSEMRERRYLLIITPLIKFSFLAVVGSRSQVLLKVLLKFFTSNQTKSFPF